jgi:hypothetical protein
MATIFLSAGLCNRTRNKSQEHLVHVNESNLHLICYTFIANYFFSLRSYITKNTIHILRTNDLYVCRYSCTLPLIFIRNASKSKILDTFVKLRKVTISFVMSVCPSFHPSACPHGTTRLPMDRFSWNLIFEDFLEICRENSSLIKIWQG